ncbi:MarR family winged helix-turn-helix transcriptional regulator [Marinobacter fonticola]|uniref:MarR family winged helix-turn-helix transcriptional regulator n=1 Tax=Marinobacter fonticola TaxID=2603215 RepID=UPI0011E6DEB7|nr:MarR family winged helix-turn-helix transcriptional regulator [Marinobacter fonticola]
MTINNEMYAIVARDCLCRKARMVDRMITRAYDDALRPIDLRITQFTLLAAIGYGGPNSISELADWLAMERTTLTRNLKLLEQNEFIAMGAGSHHRSRAIKLTAPGKNKLEQAYPLWQAVQEKFRESLGSEGWSHAHDTLAQLADAKSMK